MEDMKGVFRQFYGVLILCPALSFVVYTFFSADYNGTKGVFENVGAIYAPMIENEEVGYDSFDFINHETSSLAVEMKYIAGVRSVGECLKFRELFEISTEKDVTLYLTDITQSGNGVLAFLSSEELEEMEEIPAAFVYDKEQDLLYFFGSGVYTVEVKLYEESGAVGIYEFNLPVEVS